MRLESRKELVHDTQERPAEEIIDLAPPAAEFRSATGGWLLQKCFSPPDYFKVSATSGK